MTEKNTNNWQYLIERYFNNSISKEELEVLLQKTNNQEDLETLTLVLKDHWEKGQANHKKIGWDTKFETMMEELRQTTPVIAMQRSTRKRFIYRMAAAAAILVAVLTTFFFLFNNKNENGIASSDKSSIKENDLAPGRNTAVLTPADGTTIDLGSAKNGELTNQGNAKVMKLNDGQLAYNTTAGSSTEILYNTMHTPRGGQYKLSLPDGSLVWLNASSSIHYPTSFQGEERKVEITGEVYFEIAHDATKPFKVSVNEMEVQVLGTRFNVNAYNDEPTINTTLLEGRVKVTGLITHDSRLITPGQQARLNNTGSIKVFNNIDVDAVMAWKNGYFSFDNADMAAVMRQFSRWYDVDIVYEGKIPDRKFGGEISRNLNASQALRILEESKVHFKIEGKKIIVLP